MMRTGSPSKGVTPKHVLHHRSSSSGSQQLNSTTLTENKSMNVSSTMNTSMAATAEQNIRVAARIRPKTTREASQGESIQVIDANGGGDGCWPTEMVISSPNAIVHNGKQKFRFDAVFPETASQESVFEEMAAPLVRAVCAGFNAALFAYGQTGTGKTHTMLGEDIWMLASHRELTPKQRDALENSEMRGVIPRAMKLLFLLLRDKPHKVTVSYLEIYNEKILDLLSTSTTSSGLDIREDKSGNVQVCEATMKRVSSVEEVFDQLWKGARNRAVSSTDMNEHSSRSHTIFQVLVETKGSQNVPGTKGKLNLVDLAGSEKWRPHQLSEFSDQRIAEMTSINQSLSNLGNCVRGLLRPGRSHIPFRNSKLTRLLQDSLGGSSQCGFVVTVSPSELAHEETMSTLQFADRAKRVQVKAEMNLVETPEMIVKRMETELAKAREENRELKSRLDETAKKKSDDEDDWQKPETRLDDIGNLLGKMLVNVNGEEAMSRPEVFLKDYSEHLRSRRPDALSGPERLALLEWALALQFEQIEFAQRRAREDVAKVQAKFDTTMQDASKAERESSKKVQELMEEKLKLQQEIVDLKSQLLRERETRTSSHQFVRATPKTSKPQSMDVVPPPPPPSSSMGSNKSNQIKSTPTVVSTSSRRATTTSDGESVRRGSTEFEASSSRRVVEQPSRPPEVRHFEPERRSSMIENQQPRRSSAIVENQPYRSSETFSRRASEDSTYARRTSISDDVLRLDSMTIRRQSPMTSRPTSSTGKQEVVVVQQSPAPPPPRSFNSSRASPAITSTRATNKAQVWDRFSDEQTGRPYYFCKETGETTWRRPSGNDTATIIVRGE